MAGMLLLNFEALLSIKKRTVLDFPFPTDHSWSLYDSINVSSFKHLKHLKKKIVKPCITSTVVDFIICFENIVSRHYCIRQDRKFADLSSVFFKVLE